MRNIEIVPEGILVISEFRLSELKLLQEALVNTTISLNMSDPEQKKVHDFFTGNFMNWVNGTITTIENG